MAKVSRQYKWQIAMRTEGKCTICGKKQCQASTYFCENHRKKHCARTNKRTKLLRARRICVNCGKAAKKGRARCRGCASHWQQVAAQRFEQLKASGKCVSCGAARGGSQSTSCCRGCLLRERRRSRKRLGCKPWRPGGPGRPPLNRKALDPSVRE